MSTVLIVLVTDALLEFYFALALDRMTLFVGFKQIGMQVGKRSLTLLSSLIFGYSFLVHDLLMYLYSELISPAGSRELASA